MKQTLFTLLFFLTTFLACEVGSKYEANDVNKVQLSDSSLTVTVQENALIKCDLRDMILSYGLVNVQDVNPDIRVHLRYSSLNNFLKTIILKL